MSEAGLAQLSERSSHDASRRAGGRMLTYFDKGVVKTQIKRDQKAMLLASIRAGRCGAPHGMTKDEAVTILLQDIADFDEILARFRGHGDA